MKIGDESDKALSLRDAMASFRAREDADGMMQDAIGDRYQLLMLQHDAVHVLFGCEGEMRDELSAHVWMALGTDADLKEMHSVVAGAEHKEVLSGIGHLRLIGQWLVAIPTLVQVAWRAKRMKARVPLSQIDVMLDEPLDAIRRRYGIVPLTS